MTLERLPNSLSRASGFLPVLLIVAVLLCYGILGFAHQVSCHACGPTEVSVVHHGSAAGMGEAGGEHTEGDGASGDLGELSYAAVVVLTAIGTMLLALLLGVRKWRETVARPLVSRRHCPQVFALRPRGPTLPSLQVFRL